MHTYSKEWGHGEGPHVAPSSSRRHTHTHARTAHKRDSARRSISLRTCTMACCSLRRCSSTSAGVLARPSFESLKAYLGSAAR